MKKLVENIKIWWAKRSQPKWNVAKEHKIVPAFKWRGVQYYQFENIHNMMTGRAFAAMDYYNELKMSCTREFLIKHTEAVQNILNNTKALDLVKLGVLNTQLKERLEMIVDRDIVFKVASVIYFDANEEPYAYDFQYNRTKIEAWKEGGTAAFFLETPVASLIPYSNLSAQDLVTYMEVAQKVTEKHLKTISTLL